VTLESIDAENGQITIPDRPGLGLTLNEDFVAQATVAESGS